MIVSKSSNDEDSVLWLYSNNLLTNCTFSLMHHSIWTPITSEVINLQHLLRWFVVINFGGELNSVYKFRNQHFVKSSWEQLQRDYSMFIKIFQCNTESTWMKEIIFIHYYSNRIFSIVILLVQALFTIILLYKYITN